MRLTPSRGTSWPDLVVKKSERALVAGGTGSGKSTLLAKMLAAVRQREPRSQHLILDSKPRFRADWQLNGVKARYPGMDHGEHIPGSVIVEEPEDLALAWKRDYNVAVAQIHPWEDEPQRLSWIAQRFYETARSSQPRYLWVDETLDFYGPTGVKIKGSSPAILKTNREGREKGMALVCASQRIKGIPVQLKAEISRLYLFRLDIVDDVKFLGEMGVPKGLEAPEDNHEFYFWQKGSKRAPELMKLRLK